MPMKIKSVHSSPSYRQAIYKRHTISMFMNCLVGMALRYMELSLKGRFHVTTKMNEMNHRKIKIGRQVIQTSKDQVMDIGAVLDAD